MKDSFLIFLFILFSITSSFSQTNLDSLLNVIETTESDSSYVDACLEISRSYSTMRKDTSVVFINKAMKRAKKRNKSQWIAECYEGKAVYYDLVKESYDRAMTCMITAKKISQKNSKRFDGLISYYKAAGKNKQGRFNEAQKHYLSALSRFKDVKDTAQILYTYNKLSILYGQQNQLDESMKYLNLGIQYARASRNHYMLTSFLCNKGATQFYLGNYSVSLSSYSSALLACRNNSGDSDSYTLGLIYNSLAENHRVQNRLDSTFFYSKKAYEYRLRINHAPSIISSLGSLCQDCADLGSTDEALFYCEQMQLGLDTIAKVELEERMLSYWINYYNKVGDYESAFETLTKKTELRDKILSENNIKVQTEQQKDFEFSKERLENQREIALKNERIRFSQTQKQWLIIALSIFGLMVVVLLIQLRRNFKNRKIIDSKNVSLKQSVSDKELLLKEIHHRVKNNLQVINGLLQIQSNRSSNGEVKSILKQTQGRIFSIASIHQLLYNDPNEKKVEVSEYVDQIILQNSKVHGDKHAIVSNTEGISLEMDAAIPLGLMLNEMITNSYKHAFQEKEIGNILIELKADIGSKYDYSFTYSDNGEGFPSEMSESSKKSLGLRLIELMAKQMDAKLSVESEKGIWYQLQF